MKAKRGAMAARTCAPREMAYQSIAAETSRAPTTTSQGHDGSIPAMVATTPAVSR